LSIGTCLSGVNEAVAATSQQHGTAVAERQVHVVGQGARLGGSRQKVSAGSCRVRWPMGGHSGALSGHGVGGIPDGAR
jgi:hypothetical protein